jgi:CRP-like cAMP-binding protein
VLAHEAEIRRALLAVGKPPAEQLDELIARGKRARLARGQPFIREGDASHRMGFIHTGIVRYHVIAPDSGRDVTKDFNFAGSFTVSYSSAVLRQPARVAISAVEDCVLTVWPWVDFAAAFERDVEWQRMRRRFAEMLYVRKENRELAFLLQDAGARYEGALAQFPGDVARVPQHFLASYLGIAPESLSRLKRRER